MYNYESNSPKRYALELRARVKAALPVDAIVLCDKGEALYFVRLAYQGREDCLRGECAAAGKMEYENEACERSENLLRDRRIFFDFEAKLMRVGFQCFRSNGGILLRPRAELLIEFERRFSPAGFLTRSLERFRNSEAAENAPDQFKNLSESEKIRNSESIQKSIAGADFGDQRAKFPSTEALKLFSEGIKLLERPEPSRVNAYVRRTREFAAVALRTGRGGGCYACARIAEALEG